MKKILIVTPLLSGGGAEKFSRILSQELSLTNYNVELLLFKGAKAEFEKNVCPSVQTLKHSTLRKNALSIVVSIMKSRPDYIFSTHGYINIFLVFCTKILRLSNAKIIIRESSIPSLKNKKEKYPRLFNFLYKKIYPYSDMILCQSEAMKSDFLLNYGIRETRLKIFNNLLEFDAVNDHLVSVNLAKFPVKENETLQVCFVGRLHAVKRVDLIIKILTESLGRNFKLSIVGEGPKGETLKQQVQQNNLENNVKFCGYLDEPSQLIQKSHFMIMASEYEGFPNVVLESLSLGVPCIILGCNGGVWDLIEEFPDMFISEKADIERLGLKVSLSRKFRPQMNVLKYNSMFGIKNQIVRFEEILNEIEKCS